MNSVPVEKLEELAKELRGSTWNWSVGRLDMAARLDSLIATAKEEMTEMNICEVPHLCLHVDQPYIFRKALEWYANPTRYVSNSVYMGGGQGPTSVDIDAGQRARAALQSPAEGKP